MFGPIHLLLLPLEIFYVLMGVMFVGMVVVFLLSPKGEEWE